MRKLCENGYVGYKTISGNRAYFPAVEREACVESESRYMMSKLSDAGTKMLLRCTMPFGYCRSSG